MRWRSSLARRQHASESLVPHLKSLILGHRIHTNYNGDLVRVGIGKVSDDGTAKRMPHKEERTAFPDLFERFR
jgi:hypothetical protein